MSLGNKKGVRVTGKYAPPVDWSPRGEVPSIIHSPHSSQIPRDTPTVISIGPLPPRPSEQVHDSKIDATLSEEDWRREASSAVQSRVSFRDMGVPRQTMEELKMVLRDSPLLSIRGGDAAKTGNPYMHLHGGSSNGGGADGRQGDENPHRVFSTFKPQSDASRRGPRSRDSTSIQLPSTMDSSSSFRSAANTNRQPGVRTHTHSSSSSWGETGDSHSGKGNSGPNTSFYFIQINTYLC